MMSAVKFRLRTILLLSCLVSSFLVFSSVRCALFSLSCHQKDAFPELSDLKYDNWKVLAANSSKEQKGTAYYDELKAHADKNSIIVLISTDYGYINMALNLYYTSLQRFNITNYLYLTSSNKAAAILKHHKIQHFMIAEDSDGNSMSAYGTTAFRRKTHIKTKIILGALKYGFTVLIVDVDIVFFQNPLPYLNCTSCDIQIQSDGNEGNTGFYLARPTKAAITLHKTAYDAAMRTPSLSNQKAIDRTMERMATQGTLKMKMLNVNQFPHGNHFYEKGRRMFAGDNPCKACLIVHNNWIISGVAKEYRFKEFLMWEVDTDGYYSNPEAKYLVYDNVFDFAKQTTAIEIDALRSALSISHLLGRILILPAFHCYNCRYDSCKLPANRANLTNTAHCSLNTHVRLSTLDKLLPNSYREHVFLRHHKVPQKVLRSDSGAVLIKTDRVMAKLAHHDMKDIKHQFTPASPSKGATSTEVLRWMNTAPFTTFQILRFHSMYNAFGKFDQNYTDIAFKTALKKGILSAGYRQY